MNTLLAIANVVATLMFFRVGFQFILDLRDGRSAELLSQSFDWMMGSAGVAVVTGGILSFNLVMGG